MYLAISYSEISDEMNLLVTPRERNGVVGMIIEEGNNLNFYLDTDKVVKLIKNLKYFDGECHKKVRAYLNELFKRATDIDCIKDELMSCEITAAIALFNGCVGKKSARWEGFPFAEKASELIRLRDKPIKINGDNILVASYDIGGASNKSIMSLIRYSLHNNKARYDLFPLSFPPEKEKFAFSNGEFLVPIKGRTKQFQGLDAYLI